MYLTLTLHVRIFLDKLYWKQRQFSSLFIFIQTFTVFRLFISCKYPSKQYLALVIFSLLCLWYKQVGLESIYINRYYMINKIILSVSCPSYIRWIQFVFSNVWWRLFRPVGSFEHVQNFPTDTTDRDLCLMCSLHEYTVCLELVRYISWIRDIADRETKRTGQSWP